MGRPAQDVRRSLAMLRRASASRASALGVRARRREFFGGIWYKIFFERGPSAASFPLL